MQAKCCGDTSVRHAEIDGFNSLRLLYCGPDVTAANEASNLVVRVQIPRAARKGAAYARLCGPELEGYRLQLELPLGATLVRNTPVVARWLEQLSRKQQPGGSIPPAGSRPARIVGPEEASIMM